MTSLNNSLRKYREDLNAWKKEKLTRIMNSYAYRHENLGVTFDNRLTKGTMYKYLFPEIKYSFTRLFHSSFDNYEMNQDFFLEPNEILQVRQIRNLKELQNAADANNAKKYEWAISVEVANFIMYAREEYLSPDTLEYLDIPLSSVIDKRSKKLQCQRTFNFLVQNHQWFVDILDELAENGLPRPSDSSELIQLEADLEELKSKDTHEKIENDRGELSLNPAYLRDQIKIRDKRRELQICKSKHYQNVIRPHFDYFTNILYDFKYKNYDADRIESVQHLEQVFQLFAWFYKRLFWFEKEQYELDKRNERNARRPKSSRTMENWKKVQDCKNKGHNKTETSNTSGLSRPTVNRYWDMTKDELN